VQRMGSIVSSIFLHFFYLKFVGDHFLNLVVAWYAT